MDGGRAPNGIGHLMMLRRWVGLNIVQAPSPCAPKMGHSIEVRRRSLGLLVLSSDIQGTLECGT